jgi:hypothetical protein
MGLNRLSRFGKVLGCVLGGRVWKVGDRTSGTARASLGDSSAFRRRLGHHHGHMTKRGASELNPMARDIDELKKKYPGRGEMRHCYDLTSETRVFSNEKVAPNRTRTIKGLLTGREVTSHCAFRRARTRGSC